MVKPQVRLLCSHISHMALHSVWRDSGVTQKHGFELIVDSANVPMADGTVITMPQRAPLLLDGSYDFLSGLHHETYIYRAKGDKRFVYLAQTQNDWDDRFVVGDNVKSVKDLEGKTVVASAPAPCVLGNLRHSIEVAGADLSKINFVTEVKRPGDRATRALDAVLAERDRTWLATEREKLAYFTLTHRIRRQDLPSLTFRAGTFGWTARTNLPLVRRAIGVKSRSTS